MRIVPVKRRLPRFAFLVLVRVERVIGDEPLDGALLGVVVRAVQKPLRAGDGLLAVIIVRDAEITVLERLAIRHCVPAFDLADLGRAYRRLRVGLDGGLGRLPLISDVKLSVARGHHDASRQAAQVPLPGARPRLVEVREVEDTAALR